MKKCIVPCVVFLGLIFVPVIVSCKQTVIKASSTYITKQIPDIAQFNGIVVAGSADVEYRQSSDSTTGVSVYGADNVIEYLDITVSDGILNISFRKNTVIMGNHEIRVTASSPSLNTARIAGSGDIELKGEICSDRFDIQVSGSGNVEMEHITCDNLNASITGSGDISVAGKAGDAALNISGSGELDCDRMICNNLLIKITGSGDAEIDSMACTNFQGEIVGSGNVSVDGSAEKAVFRITGSGNISAAGLIAGIVEAGISGSGNVSCHAVNSITASTAGSGDIVYSGDPAQVNASGRKNGVRRR